MSGKSIRSLALAVGLAGGPWSGCAQDEAPAPQQDRARLVAALGARRVLVPRLTGGFSYGPCDQPLRMVCGSPPEVDEAAALAQFRSFAELERSGSANEAALADLLASPGDQARVARAVQALEVAAAGEADAEILSDLAAAYLVRAEVEDDPRDILRAATSALAAVANRPDLPEARFNLALAFDSLSVPEGARSAWQEYLRVEEEPGWRVEGEERLNRVGGLSGRSLRVGRRERRERVLEELLPAWGDHSRSGRTGDADRLLEEARSVGAALATDAEGAGGGDAMARDLVREVDSASPARRGRLADGWSAFGRGVQLYRRRDAQSAAREFADAVRALGTSPGAGWAIERRALCAYQQGRYDTALRLLERIEPITTGTYPALAGRVSWIRGTVAILQDRPAEGFAAYRQAVAAFEWAREPGSRVAVELRWTASLASQGAHDEAWRRRLRVLREAPDVSSAVELRVLFTEAGQASLAAGHPAVAVVYFDEALHQLRAFSDPAAVVAVRRSRALALHRLGRASEAYGDLAVARRLLPQIVDPAHRTLAGAETDVLEGEILESSDPSAAVAALSEAIDRFQRSSLLNLLPRSYLGRARAYRRLSREDDAAADLDAAIELIESRRVHAESAIDRTRFLADVRQVYEEAVDLEARAGRVTRAFERAEALHARALDDALHAWDRSANGTPPWNLSLETVRHGLPPGTRLLAYLVLPDRLLRWSVDRTGIDLESVAVSSEELGRQVRRLLDGVHGGDPATVRAASEILSVSILGSTGPFSGNLLVVPDGPLHDLPFDLLIDMESGSSLVESVAVGLVPSASIHARIVGRDRDRRLSEVDSVLVVSDPAFSPAAFPGLPRLPGAKAEGDAVASVYPSATVLAAEAASAEGLLQILGRHPVVHVAAHAVPNPGDPRLSYLVLAGGPLYARQIAAHRLDHTRVVVLSACGTGRTGTGGGEGLAGLSQAFLEAGASAVVGTVWPVDDRAVVPLLTAFHQRLLAGADPASALRSAKLERLRAGDPPSVWAAFEHIGAAAPEGEAP